MTVHHYRSKPVQVQAYQWTGGAHAAGPLINWVLAHGGTARYHDAGERIPGPGRGVTTLPEYIAVDTYHHTARAVASDYIIKDAWDQFDVIDETTFRARYEEVQR